MKKSQNNVELQVNALRRMVEKGYLKLLRNGIKCGKITDESMIDGSTSLLTFSAENGKYDVCELLLKNQFTPVLSREISINNNDIRSCVELIEKYANGDNFEEVEQKKLSERKGSLDGALQAQKAREKFNYNDTLKSWE